MAHNRDPIRLIHDDLSTPLGRLDLVADDAGRLRAAGWADGHARMERRLRAYADRPAYSVRRGANPGGWTAAFGAYFAGDLTAFQALPVLIEEGTAFQQAVWSGLRTIPMGQTLSYGQLARRIGNPSAVRAVGLANGSNPIAVVVPCHRVIGSDGSLTGYGGGLHRKRWLLAHERRGELGPHPPAIP